MSTCNCKEGLKCKHYQKTDDSSKKNEPKIDQGHVNLIEDLEGLLFLARNYDFHDFKNENFAAPKLALMEKAMLLNDNVKQGRYDN